jgi:hypothetical protein
MKEKEDILLQKDLERRQALDLLQEQTENEYKQFLEEHKDMLDKALKAAREQHNKDKVRSFCYFKGLMLNSVLDV